MTFAPVHLHGYRCRTKPDSTSKSGRLKGRCALESAAARRDRARGLGRYLSVESASCGLGCRASEAVKTCGLELTDKRTWVSSVYVPLFYGVRCCHISVCPYFSLHLTKCRCRENLSLNLTLALTTFVFPDSLLENWKRAAMYFAKWFAMLGDCGWSSLRSISVAGLQCVIPPLSGSVGY